MARETILTLNAGSSSIKFALFESDDGLAECARGQVERIGGSARLRVVRTGQCEQVREVGNCDHARALELIFAQLNEILGGRTLSGVGHRVVHGGPDFAQSRELDVATLGVLETFVPWAPLHQPYNLAAVDGAIAAFPEALQIGCFDTAFHRGQPWASEAFALPRQYYEKGIRRYGFHGLSYQYVTMELLRILPELAGGKAVIAHLGNGCSMCAVDKGRSIASTMGFTALDGLAMGTRCGQIDPGVLLYLMLQEGLAPAELATLLYRESGLKGLSGISSDMRELEASDTPEAKQAIDYFVYRIRRELGALAAVLGGLDALVFCGGIGENSRLIRRRVCEDLEWLGIDLDDAANDASVQRIGTGRVQVLILPTNEELIIAQAVQAHLHG